MRQRIYFSGVGKPDLWNSRFLTGVSKQMLGFLTWDATPDLAQATWEWPYWGVKENPASWQSAVEDFFASPLRVTYERV